MARVDLTADVLGDDEPPARRSATTTPPATTEPEREQATAGPVKEVYLSARVARPLRDRLQMQAIRERRPLKALVTQAVEDYLTAHERT